MAPITSYSSFRQDLTLPTRFSRLNNNGDPSSVHSFKYLRVDTGALKGTIIMFTRSFLRSQGISITLLSFRNSERYLRTSLTPGLSGVPVLINIRNFLLIITLFQHIGNQPCLFYPVSHPYSIPYITRQNKSGILFLDFSDTVKPFT